MDQFVIHGGKALQGEITVGGAKNVAFPLICASILTKGDCIIKNVPRIEDVFRLLEILEGMGAQVEWQTERTVRVNTKNIDPNKIDKKRISRFRGSVLLFGPLLARFGKVAITMPGGDIIGARPIDTHIDAFRQLGISVKSEKQGYTLEVPKNLTSGEVILNEFSVTATENLLLFAALQDKKIRIKTADQDYQVQELIKFLKKMGVLVKMSGVHVLEVQGKKVLGGAQGTLIGDPIEAGTFIVMAAATKGTVKVKNVETQYLELFLKKLRDFGVSLRIDKKEHGRTDVTVLPWTSLKIDKIQSFIYPGIHSDLQSALGVLATQAKGSTLLHDPLYEGRLKYLEELNKMGAEIYIADPHRAIINGPTRLLGSDLGTFDLRGGAAMIIAALTAQGTSAINNIYQVDRGYEHIEKRLQKLGADITRITD
jgi:UDP-N-acetylglucosamine 1-carboxyvinyltransferase